MSLSKQMIMVKNVGGYNYEELNAAEAGIYPGMVCERVTATTCRKNRTEEKKVPLLVAIEDSLQGHDVAEVYAINNPVRLVQLRPGDEFLARIEAFQAISIHELIVPNSEGNFKSAGDSSIDQNGAVAEALEAITLDDAVQLCHCKVL